jgi:hypothetical protein
LFILKHYYPQMENWRSPWQIKLLDSLAQCIMFATVLFWRSIRNCISARFIPEMSNRSQSTDAEQAGRGDGDKPCC